MIVPVDQKDKAKYALKIYNEMIDGEQFASDWDEERHPRDKGKFSPKEGEGSHKEDINSSKKGHPNRLPSPEDTPEAYVYHRGGDPRTHEHSVLAADSRDAIESYGNNEYAIPRDNLTDIPSWVSEYATGYYKEEYGDDYEVDPDEVDPPDIVSTGGIWDDQDFVRSLWDDNEDKLLDMVDNGIFGFETSDGAIIFPGPDISKGGWDVREDNTYDGTLHTPNPPDKKKKPK